MTKLMLLTKSFILKTSKYHQQTLNEFHVRTLVLMNENNDQRNLLKKFQATEIHFSSVIITTTMTSTIKLLKPTTKVLF